MKIVEPFIVPLCTCGGQKRVFTLEPFYQFLWGKVFLWTLGLLFSWLGLKTVSLRNPLLSVSLEVMGLWWFQVAALCAGMWSSGLVIEKQGLLTAGLSSLGPAVYPQMPYLYTLIISGLRTQRLVLSHVFSPAWEWMWEVIIHSREDWAK